MDQIERSHAVDRGLGVLNTADTEILSSFQRFGLLLIRFTEDKSMPIPDARHNVRREAGEDGQSPLKRVKRCKERIATFRDRRFYPSEWKRKPADRR